MALHSLATITVDGVPGVVSVDVRGEIDASNAADFAEIVEPFTTSPRLVVDCERITFIDSSGLEVLLHIADARRTIAACVLRYPSDDLQRLLQLTGITEAFDLELADQLTCSG